MRSLLVVTFLLGSCGAPAPQPSPSPSPSPTPPVCHQPVGLEPSGQTLPSLYVQKVREAQASLGDACGLDPESSIERVADVLRKEGICAWRDEDRVFIWRELGSPLWEEHHPVLYLSNAFGCWRSNTYTGSLTE